MQNFKKRLTAGILALSTATIAAAPLAFAEGSIDLTEVMTGPYASKEQGVATDEAYRPYLEWRDRTQLGSGTDNGLESKSVFYVYAKQGEMVYFGQSNRHANSKSITAVSAKGTPTAAQMSDFETNHSDLIDSTIAVTMPVSKTEAFDPTSLDGAVQYVNGSTITSASMGDNKVYLFKPNGTTGVITSLEEEQNGPNYGSVTNGYDPFSFVAPVEGTYSFRFLTDDYAASEREQADQIQDTDPVSPDVTFTFESVPKADYTRSIYTPDNKLAAITQSTLSVVGAPVDSEFYGKTFSKEYETNVLYLDSYGDPAKNRQVVKFVPAEDGYVEAQFLAGSQDISARIYQNGANLSWKTIKAGVLDSVSAEVTAGEPVYFYATKSSYIYAIRYEEIVVATEEPEEPAEEAETGSTASLMSVALDTSNAVKLNAIGRGSSFAGVASLSDVTETTLYEAGTDSVPWTSDMISAWTGSNGTTELNGYGFQLSAGNSSAHRLMSIAPQANDSVITLEAEWYGISGLGRTYAQGNASFFRYGNIYILENDQSQGSAYALNAESAANAVTQRTSFPKEIAGFRKGISERPYYMIKMQLDKDLNVLRYLKVYSSAAPTVELLSIEDQPLTSTEYNTLEFGYHKTGSIDSTTLEVLKSIKVTEEVKGTAPYSLNYTYNGTAINTTSAKASNSIDAGTVINAESVVYDESGNKYFAQDGASLSFTVAADSTNEFTVPLRKANVYNVSITASTGGTIASQSVIEGDSVTLPYPRYILVGKTLYSTGTTNSGYRKYIASVTRDQTIEQTYTARAEDKYNDIVFYTEAENIAGLTATTSGNVPIRSSNAGAVVSTADTVMATLEKGTYEITGGLFTGSQSGTRLEFTIGENEFSLVHTGLSNLTEVTSEVVTIDEPADLIFKPSGNKKYAGLDYLFVRDITEYPLTIASNPAAGGTISAAVSGSAVTAVKEGRTVTLTAAPAEGYNFGSVYEVVDENGEFIDVDIDANGVGSFTMPASPVTITGYFCETGKPGSVIVQYVDTTNSNDIITQKAYMPDASTYTIGGEYTYYLPAYVEKNGTYYKYEGATLDAAAANYSGTATLLDGQPVIATANYAPAERVVYFAEAESAGAGTSNPYSQSGSKYSSGAARSANANGGSYLYLNYTPTEEGTYIFEGPLSNDNSKARDGYIYITEYVNSGKAGRPVFTFSSTHPKYTVPGSGVLSSGFHEEAVLEGGKTYTFIFEGANISTLTPILDYLVITRKEDHNINVAATTNGTVTTVPSGKAAEGREIKITTTPDRTYRLDTLTATYVGTNSETQTLTISENQTFTMPAADVTITATFVTAEDAGALTVKYIDEEGIAIGSDTPVLADGNGLAYKSGEMFPYFYPAYVAYDGKYYEAATTADGIFGSTTQLTQEAKTVTVTYKECSAVAYAEGEEIAASAGAANTDISYDSRFSKGKTRMLTGTDANISMAVTIPTAGIYEFTGPLYNAESFDKTVQIVIDGTEYQTVTVPANGTASFSVVKDFTAAEHTFSVKATDGATPYVDYAVIKAKTPRTITTVVEPANSGSITVGTTLTVSGLPAAGGGQTVTVSATPNVGGTLKYIKLSYTENETEVTKRVTGTSFVMPDADATLTAVFDSADASLFRKLPRANSPQAVANLSAGSAAGTMAVGDYVRVYGTSENPVTVASDSITINSSNLNTPSGIIEVIPYNTGVINVAYSGSIVVSQGAYTSDAISAMNDNILAAGTGANIRVPVYKDVPIYIYTTDTATVTSIYLDSSTNKANDVWGVESPSFVGAWDITVVGDGQKKSGRVWTDVLFLNARAHKQSIYPSAYILTRDGFEYKFDFNGLQPYSFLFYSNRRGLLMDKVGEDGKRNVQSLFHSYFSYGTANDVGAAPTKKEKNGFESKIYANIHPYNEDVDQTHRIFLNQLSTEDDAVKVYTNDGELSNGTGSALLQLITPKFSGYGGNAYDGKSKSLQVPKSTIGLGGKFTFTIAQGANGVDASDPSKIYVNDIDDVKGRTYVLALDFNLFDLDEVVKSGITTYVPHTKPVTYYDEDGNMVDTVPTVDVWTKHSDMAESTAAELGNSVLLAATITDYGDYTIVWDGKDAYGNDVPVTVEYNPSTGEFETSHYIALTGETMGEIHMPMADVERLPHGIKVERLNNIVGDTNSTKIFYNNQAIRPEFGTATTSDFEGTATLSKTEGNSYNYSVDDSTWYYTGKQYSAYPKMIGDGQNALGGVDTSVGEGGMVVGNYPTDEEGSPDWAAEPAWESESSNASVSDGEGGYGNYAALDMWSSYISIYPMALSFGVNPENDTDISPAIVSYVKEDINESAIANTPFDDSHVREADGTEEYHPENHGLPTAWMTAPNGSYIKNFGHTISTGFVSNKSAGDGTYSGVLWSVDVPADDQTYLKLSDSDTEGGWATLADKTNRIATDITEGYTPVNPGSIYKTTGVKFNVKFMYSIPNTTPNNGEIIVGIVLDNIYAPTAMATTTYVNAEDYETASSSGTYNDLSGLNPVYATDGTYDGANGFLADSNNPYKTGYGDGNTVLWSNSAFGQLFDAATGVDMYGNAYDDELQSIGDDSMFNSGEANQIDDEIYMGGEDEIETIDDILGAID